MFACDPTRYTFHTDELFNVDTGTPARDLGFENGDEITRAWAYDPRSYNSWTGAYDVVGTRYSITDQASAAIAFVNLIAGGEDLHIAIEHERGSDTKVAYIEVEE